MQININLKDNISLLVHRKNQVNLIVYLKIVFKDTNFKGFFIQLLKMVNYNYKSCYNLQGLCKIFSLIHHI